MSAALHHAPRARQPGFAALRLEDFSARLLPGTVADAESLLRARAEGQAEGAAQTRDQQLADLAEALRQHALAVSEAAASQTRHAQAARAEVAALLRAVAGALLPLGRDARLVDALVDVLEDAGEAALPRARIHCPPYLHDTLRRACRDAGLTLPDLTAAPDVALHLDGGVTRIDLAAMQARLLHLIDDFATGEP